MKKKANKRNRVIERSEERRFFRERFSEKGSVSLFNRRTAQSLYEFIISFIIFLIIAIFLFKMMIDMGPKSAETFEMNTGCMQAYEVLEYSTSFKGSNSKLGLVDSPGILNYTKWEYINSEDYITLKESKGIEFPFRLEYIVKELPLNKTDPEPSDKPNETSTSVYIIRTATGVKLYAGTPKSEAKLNLILKTSNNTAAISQDSNPCTYGTLESGDSTEEADGKIIINLDLTTGDLDCFEYTFTNPGDYLYIDFISFTDPLGKRTYPVYLSNRTKILDEYGSLSENENECQKEKYVILEADNERLVTKMRSSSWK